MLLLVQSTMGLVDKLKKNFYWFPSILMAISAILKFAEVPQVVEFFTSLGLQDMLIYLGVVELSCVVIFLFPHTMLVGFILVCCYWGGAMGANLIGSNINYFPIAMLLLFGVSFYLRKASLFLNYDD